MRCSPKVVVVCAIVCMVFGTASITANAFEGGDVAHRYTEWHEKCYQLPHKDDKFPGETALNEAIRLSQSLKPQAALECLSAVHRLAKEEAWVHPMGLEAGYRGLNAAERMKTLFALAGRQVSSIRVHQPTLNGFMFMGAGCNYADLSGKLQAAWRQEDDYVELLGASRVLLLARTDLDGRYSRLLTRLRFYQRQTVQHLKKRLRSGYQLPDMSTCLKFNLQRDEDVPMSLDEAFSMVVVSDNDKRSLVVPYALPDSYQCPFGYERADGQEEEEEEEVVVGNSADFQVDIGVKGGSAGSYNVSDGATAANATTATPAPSANHKLPTTVTVPETGEELILIRKNVPFHLVHAHYTNLEVIGEVSNVTGLGVYTDEDSVTRLRGERVAGSRRPARQFDVKTEYTDDDDNIAGGNENNRFASLGKFSPPKRQQVRMPVSPTYRVFRDWDASVLLMAVDDSRDDVCQYRVLWAGNIGTLSGEFLWSIIDSEVFGIEKDADEV